MGTRGAHKANPDTIPGIASNAFHYSASCIAYRPPLPPPHNVYSMWYVVILQECSQFAYHSLFDFVIDCHRTRSRCTAT